MKIQSLINAGSWLPYNREMAVTFGADVAMLFSELCHLSEQYQAERLEGWFFVPQAKLAELTGLKRTQLERCMEDLAKADLLMIDARGMHNTRHFKLETNPAAISAACAAHAAAPKQTHARAPKAAHKPKQAANTGKECEPHVEPVGISEQLVPVAKPVKPKTDNSEINSAAARLVEHLNAVAGTAFRSNAKGNVDKFARVLKSKEGTEEEIRMVIEFKTMRWGNDPVMRAYLTPETLSRPSKFPGYLEEAYNAKGQQSRPTAITDLVPVQSDTVAIMLPSGQQFGGYYEKKDQRKVDMVKAVLLAHPGIEEHLDPRLGMPAYLAGMRDIDLQNELKKAKSIYNTVNYKNPFWI
jgi:uncharacterized phage protein (TIGR02220 family)